MSDSVEKLILQFWGVHMADQLGAERVFNQGPEDDNEPLPYVTFDVTVEGGPRTNTGGYDEAEVAFEVFCRVWRDGLNIVTQLKSKLEDATLAGSGVLLDRFRFDAGGHSREPDGVHHFIHTYSLRLHQEQETE